MIGEAFLADIRAHTWQPIEDLPSDWSTLRDTELHSLMTAWQEQAGSMRAGRAYDEFLVRLRREWAIETGHERFDKWIDQAIVEGLDYWRKAIGA